MRIRQFGKIELAIDGLELLEFTTKLPSVIAVAQLRDALQECRAGAFGAGCEIFEIFGITNTLCIDVKAPSITEIAAMSRLKPASVDSSERIGWQVVESQLAAMLAREISKAGVEVESSAPIQRRQQC